MSFPVAAFPVWVPVLLALLVAGLVAWIVVELCWSYVCQKKRKDRPKTKGGSPDISDLPATGFLRIKSRWASAGRALPLRKGADTSDRETSTGQRGPRSPISGFPVGPVALALVLVLAVLTAISFFAVFRSPGTLGFQATFLESGAPEGETNTIKPTVGTVVPISAELDPPGEQLLNAAIAITGPSTIILSDCYAEVQRKVEGYAKGPQARINLGDLDGSDGVEVECNLTVAHRIRRIETVELELTAANSSMTEKQHLVLEPPDVEQGQETAEAHADREIHNSPALWDRSLMIVKPGAFEEQGEEWPLIDPRRLHAFRSEPEGRSVTIHQLEDTRVQSSKILTLEGFITSRPVTQDTFKAKGSGRKADRQVFSIGQSPSEQGGWCSTTRSESQAHLREGDRIRVRATVVEWGRSRASGGIAVMLDCPAVKIVGPVTGPESASRSGAATVSRQFNHGGVR